jgi:hypothetical protein
MIHPVYSVEDSTALLYVTCRIVARDTNGKESIGTGFFFSYPAEPGKALQVLVTNKHVVANAVAYDLYFHEAEGEPGEHFRPSGKIHGFRLRILDQGWFNHPSDDVDLCAMPIEPFRQEAERAGKKLFLTTLSTEHIPDDHVIHQLLALETVTMIGYPIGLWDKVNNLPISRRGMTASHPRVDFNGKRIGVVDIAAFPGSSGSPVLIVNEGGYAIPGGFVAGGSRILLLGILYAGPQFEADGSLEIKEIPTTWTASFSVALPVHLGFYIKSQELLELGKVLFEADAKAKEV